MAVYTRLITGFNLQIFSIFEVGPFLCRIFMRSANVIGSTLDAWFVRQICHSFFWQRIYSQRDMGETGWPHRGGNGFGSDAAVEIEVSVNGCVYFHILALILPVSALYAIIRHKLSSCPSQVPGVAVILRTGAAWQWQKVIRWWWFLFTQVWSANSNWRLFKLLGLGEKAVAW